MSINQDTSYSSPTKDQMLPESTSTPCRPLSLPHDFLSADFTSSRTDLLIPTLHQGSRKRDRGVDQESAALFLRPRSRIPEFVGTFSFESFKSFSEEESCPPMLPTLSDVSISSSDESMWEDDMSTSSIALFETPRLSPGLQEPVLDCKRLQGTRLTWLKPRKVSYDCGDSDSLDSIFRR